VASCTSCCQSSSSPRWKRTLADQFDNAVLCERAGAALVVMPEEASAARIRAALDRVLEEPSFAEAAGRVAAEIAAMPSADEVAQRVEAHAAAG
jgi:UDP:flavonoid glycosyltransferase YjiC (YdhE family)